VLSLDQAEDEEAARLLEAPPPFLYPFHQSPSDACVYHHLTQAEDEEAARLLEPPSHSSSAPGGGTFQTLPQATAIAVTADCEEFDM
jgi:hypothetical protein